MTIFFRQRKKRCTLWWGKKIFTARTLSIWMLKRYLGIWILNIDPITTTTISCQTELIVYSVQSQLYIAFTFLPMILFYAYPQRGKYKREKTSEFLHPKILSN